MKSLYLIILFLSVQTVAAQQKSLNPRPKDLIVIRHQLRIFRVDVSRSDPPPGIDNSHQFEGEPPRYDWRAKPELQVQNTGSKSIKSIDWRLLLVAEVNSTKEINPFDIRSRKTIRPGETVTLAGLIRNQSLKAISKRRDKGLVKERVDITRIEYADGSIWEGEKSIKVPITY
jgi:hypothetical protein